MRIVLENELWKAEIKRFGAELKSLVRKEDGQEYLWEADPAYWGKTSPILFPFIGKLEGAGFSYQGRFYEMDKHGFARDMDFTVVAEEQHRVVLAIESNEETLHKFPFTFRLEVEYILENSGIQELIRVYNRGENTMYFSVGGHPAFACPLVRCGRREGSRTDSLVRLYGVEERKEVTATVIGVPDGFLTGETYSVALEQGVFPVTEHLFDQDAVVLAEQGVTAVGLLNADGAEYVRMEADCPVWGIWSMPDQGACYICIEPWWGICDSKGYQGSIEERPYTNTLEAGGVWEHGFRIRIGA
ncbi:MAG: aldose 1-epimerase family protein [Lachnospiraceae bacterium]|nr:aldose 1-epimerase family protein [Lachnospiraceae bacterium]